MREQPPSWKRSRCGADARGTNTPRAVSISTAPSTTMRPRSRADQPGDRIDQRGLAGARTAEQRGQPAFGCRKRRRARNRRGGGGPRRSIMSQPERAGRVGALDQPSETNSAAIEIATTTSVSRSAPRSPPGTWVKRVDRGRQCLRLAGDVRDEGDRRAEFAEGAGERQHHAGEDAGQDSGRVTSGKPRRAAPSVPAASSRPPVDRVERQPDRAHHQRKAHDGAGERRAGPAEREDDAEPTRRASGRAGLCGRTAAAGYSRSPPAARPAAGARRR